MKDLPLDEPVPLRYEPSNYHRRKIAELKEEIRATERLTSADAEVRAAAEYQEELHARDGLNREAEELRNKYSAMLAQVRTWQPPTIDHQRLKDFMVYQLEKSMRRDCGSYDWPIERLSGERWKAERLASLYSNLAYHEKHHQGELERTRKRNEWIAALVASLEK